MQIQVYARELVLLMAASFLAGAGLVLFLVAVVGNQSALTIAGSACLPVAMALIMAGLILTVRRRVQQARPASQITSRRS